MGLKRFVSSMLRKSPICPSEPGKLAAGCPSVFAEDGTWNAKFPRKTVREERTGDGSVKKQQSSRKEAEQPPTFRLPRKRSWLLRRMVPS
ncbi:uncharacterized protein LOC128254769 [Drosophila gunungcola]|uniref:Uncharacterized protein n=1 Tax=Drosophila gunungcola TaxID=103775 RepID=A0A9P9YL65_9MUSC|nr:uncharacterized protein LOC128254769 [Drosophila gunungcola]KAI8038579.1 hypothetical protein M5D96_008487 [Drosophila gunungcola]